MGQPIPLVASATPGATPSGAIPVSLYGLADQTLIQALTPVSAANGVAAAGATPTKAEYDVVVALTNANKVAINAIIAALKA